MTYLYIKKKPCWVRIFRGVQGLVTYIVTQNDTTSYNIGKKGIVRVTLYECERNSDTDRIKVDTRTGEYVERISQ